MSYSDFRDTFQGKHILIFGLGILGGGKAALTAFQEFPCEIIITDKKTEEELASTLKELSLKNVKAMHLGDHDQADIDWADVIIKNPAVREDHPLIHYAFRQGKRVTTEAALYLKFSEALTIGITGTRGKTTTTLLTHHLISGDTSKKVLLGGNIRDKGCLPLLLEETPDYISILELSSFALEGCYWEKVSPHIAAITNIYADHQDRYNDVISYARAKAGIFTYQKPNDIIFLDEKDEHTAIFQPQITSQLRLIDPHAPELNSFHLKGEHNKHNAAFAIEIAKAVGIDSQTIKERLSTFQGAAFRQQIVGEHQGKIFVNDSTSTTPEAVMVALQAYPNATFIIGGTTKKLPLQKLADSLKKFQGHLLFLRGSGTSELIKHFDQKPKIFDSLKDAFVAALETQNKEIIFSPGFTSFELFKNEFDRAEQFNALVEAFKKDRNSLY